MSSKKRTSRRDFTKIAFGTISTMMIKLDIKPFVSTTTTLHHPYQLVLHGNDWIVDPYCDEREEHYSPTWKTIWKELGQFAEETLCFWDFDELVSEYGEKMAEQYLKLSPETRFYRFHGVKNSKSRCTDYDLLDAWYGVKSTTWYSAGVELCNAMPQEDTDAVDLCLEDCCTTGNKNCFAHVDPSKVDKLNDLLLQRGINVIVKKWWSDLSEEFDVKDADTSWQEEQLNSPG